MVAGSGTRCCGNRISKPSGDGGKKDIGLGVLHLPKAHRAGEAFAGLSDTMSFGCCSQRCYASSHAVAMYSHVQASRYSQRRGPQKLLLCAKTSAMSWTAGTRAESESERTQRLKGSSNSQSLTSSRTQLCKAVAQNLGDPVCCSSFGIYWKSAPSLDCMRFAATVLSLFGLQKRLSSETASLGRI